MKRLITVVLIIFAFWFIFSLFPSKPILIDYHAVTYGPVEDIVTNSKAGIVSARHQSQLSVEIAGKITQINARERTSVKKNDVLYQMDELSAQLNLKQRQASVDLAKAQVDKAKALALKAQGDLKRTERLKRNEQISEEEYQSQLHTFRSLKAEEVSALAAVDEAQALLQLARLDCGRCIVRAPFDGVVTVRYKDIGEWVIPGDPILEVVSYQDLYVLLNIDETDIGKIKKNLPVRLFFDPWRDVHFMGKITKTSGKLISEERQNRTLEIEVSIDDDNIKNYELIPGISSDCEILIHKKDNVLRIPTIALLEGDQVWVVEDEIIVQKKITTGIKNWQWVEVVDGLNENDKLVTSLDNEQLKPGVRVSFTDDY